MKILLTGASSSPGFKTLIELADKGYKVYAIYNRNPINITLDNVEPVKLDLTDFSSVVKLFQEVEPDIVIHMAAIGDVDLCEKDRELAWKTNVETTRLLVKLCLKNNVKMIYLSTDYVFDGTRGLYKEEDLPNPINYYGLTKLISEEIVKSALDRYVIVRTSAVYGLGIGRKNFGKALIEALSRGQKVKAIVDQWLSPTLNTLLAKAIVEIMEKDLEGIFHVAGERVSRYEFAVRLAKKFGFDTNLIEQARMDEFNWIAKRPRDSSLDCTKARKMLSTDFHTLDYSLDVLYSEWMEEVKKVGDSS